MTATPAAALPLFVPDGRTPVLRGRPSGDSIVVPMRRISSSSRVVPFVLDVEQQRPARPQAFALWRDNRSLGVALGVLGFVAASAFALAAYAVVQVSRMRRI